MIARIVFAAVLCTAVARAETVRSATAEVTLDDAIALYRQRSPRLAATQAAVGVAGADVVEARIYPNPELALSMASTAQGDTAGPGAQYQADLSLPILVGRQRARRAAAALAHLAATRAEVAGTQAEGELEVRTRFVVLLASQENTQVLEQALADTRAVRDIVAGRSSAGAGSPYAVSRIDLAIAMLASRVDAARADETSAAGELAKAIGMPGWHPHARGDLVVAAPPTQASLAVDQNHPELRIARANQAAARADVARAYADRIPTPSLGIQALRTSGPDGLALGVGLSIPLPLFDRNQGAVARATAETHRIALELAARHAELATELDRATRVLAARRDALARFQAGLAHLAEVRSMAEASYRSGQGGIVELLDALDAIADARLHEVELRAAVADAELAVRRAALGR